MNLKDLQIYNERGSLYYILSYINVVEGILGIVFTSLLIISSFRLIWKSKSPHYKICFGILISDFIYSLSIIIIGFAAIINGEYLATHSWFCGFIDIFYVGGVYTSIWCGAVMALERGLLIIHKIRFPLWFWIGAMMLELILFLAFNLVSIFRNQIGLADLATYCMSTPDYPIGFITINLYFVTMTLCLVTVLYSYVGIAITQRKKAWNDIKDLNMSENETLKKANRIIGKVLFLLILFLACNLIEFINTVYELISENTRSSAADFTSIVMLNINPIANCIILIQFHDPIKVSLLESYPILNKILVKKNSENTQARSVLLIR
jgi:hypothetical protein